ncbi:methionine--tRNA ligase [Burkholderia cenocepacia]|uniref:methionine--tRNA ligase n=1 Tax=Burkholderia cenocepacia TaxID=95486 RepID=UPI001B96C977|nr:methionine--tRNA ligase [Burkholderia cenocepacia]MBR8097935.1 methionine--tRNA ligase [Burkholderia cenocepacia]MDI9688422.1 methionine--tRNA ligase [Burkholderia cenocepacia]HEP6427900.1 methionine--tRNA ligase [Burkholderia cenocepacia]
MPIDTIRDPRHYLLVPAMPAPNGRLHLGHIAGPYLRLDMLARHLRSRGEVARIACASDPYDSYIPLRAGQAGIDAAALARQSCAGIVDDLAAMNIDVDLFVDPLGDAHHDAYLAAHDGLVARLAAQRRVSTVRERMPYSAARDGYVTGSFLLGHCPQCARDVSGFFCEDCGAHFQPEDVREPSARWGETLAMREQDNLFFDIADPAALVAQLVGTETAPVFVDIARRHLARDGARFRLTSHAGWGLPYVLDGEPRTLFGHGLLFGAIRFVGDLYARRHGLRANPFDRDSDVITVNGFGIDNCVSHLVGIQAMAMADGVSKPFDRFVINHFYTLEGRKFSTSLRWAIWVEDLAARTRVPADAVRGFVASTNPVAGRTDFDRDAFCRFVNGPYATVRRHVAEAIGGPLAARVPTDETVRAAEAAWRDAQRAMDFATFDPTAMAGIVERWSARFDGARAAGDLYGWTKGFALLAWPLMPALAQTAWRALGLRGEPNAGDFARLSSPIVTPLANFDPVTPGDLAAVLPPGMREVA